MSFAGSVWPGEKQALPGLVAQDILVADAQVFLPVLAKGLKILKRTAQES